MPSTVEPSRRFSPSTEPLVFRDVGGLLARPDTYLRWLDRHSEHEFLLQDALSCLVRLCSHTGLAHARLLSLIGCPTDSNFADLPIRHLEECTRYLRWIETLVSDLDLHPDKRLTLVGAARFFLATNRDLDQCTQIVSYGPFSPRDYLQLGEISQAWQTAFRALPGPLGERARAIHDSNPFRDCPTPHLSSKRIDMLRSPNADEILGIRVAARIKAHLQSCRDCADYHNTN